MLDAKETKFVDDWNKKRKHKFKYILLCYIEEYVLCYIVSFFFFIFIFKELDLSLASILKLAKVILYVSGISIIPGFIQFRINEKKYKNYILYDERQKQTIK